MGVEGNSNLSVGHKPEYLPCLSETEAPKKAESNIPTDQITTQEKVKKAKDIYQKYLASEPRLPAGNPANGPSGDMATSQWFQPSPLATFMSALLDMIDMLKDLKEVESENFQKFVDVTIEMAKDIKEHIIKSAEAQAKIHTINAWTSGAMAVTSGLQAGYMAGKATSLGRSGLGADQISSRLHTASIQSQAVKGLVDNITNAVKEGLTASQTLVKGQHDASSDQLRSMKQVIDSLLNEALQGEKDAANELKEIIQAFRQMEKEHMQGHSWR